MRGKPKPKSDHFPVAMALDSGEQSQLTVTGVKNTRLKRLKVRRLDYICRTKMNAETVKQLEEKKKKEDSNDPAKNRISFSMSSTSGKGVVTSCQRDSSEKFSAYGSVSIIGRRREMEDALTVEFGFMTKSNDSRDGTSTRYDFFGVYDGHGGAHVARACEKRLHGVLVAEVGEHPGEGVEYWERVMEGCFRKMDEEVRDNGVGKTVGSTVVVGVVGEEEVVVANCGDCRAVICRGGVALALSKDHMPDRPDELNRIEAAGGRVINWNGQRVLGVLATSRSIGDHYLRPYVISKPEVTTTKRTDKDEFLILASDGLWGVISNEVACLVVRRCLDGKMKRAFLEVEKENRAAEAAAVLAELAMARGSKDNISVIVVELRKPKGFLRS